MTPETITYKSSGIDWLGDIPSHWEVSRLKNISKVVLGKMLAPADKGNYILKPYLKSKNIGWGNLILDEVETMWFSERELDLYRIKENDLLVSEGGEVGKTSIWKNELEECYIQNSVQKITVNEDCVPEFYLNLMIHLGSTGVFKSIVNQVSIAHLTKDILINIPVPVPPLLEQQAIARHLIEQSEKIDAFINHKQRFIDLLREQKQAIINEAVTKGIYRQNNDNHLVTQGDYHYSDDAPWLVEVPGNWEIRRAKTLFQLITDAAPAGNHEELLSVYTHIGVEPRKDLEAKGNKSTTTDNYWIVKKRDIIINKLLMWMGAVGLSKYDGVTSPAYDIIRAKEDALPEYYHYLLRSPIMRGQYLTRSRGIMEMRLRLYFEDFCTVMLPVPPLAEQADIVAYIEQESDRIDKLMNTAKKQVAYMQEYRSAMITESVTGGSNSLKLVTLRIV